MLLLIVLAVATFKKIQRMLLLDFEFGRLRMGFFVAILLYNFTEAAFKGVSLVWLVWHIMAIEYPRRNRDSGERASGSGSDASLPHSTLQGLRA